MGHDEFKVVGNEAWWRVKNTDWEVDPDGPVFDWVRTPAPEGCEWRLVPGYLHEWMIRRGSAICGDTLLGMVVDLKGYAELNPVPPVVTAHDWDYRDDERRDIDGAMIHQDGGPTSRSLIEAINSLSTETDRMFGAQKGAYVRVACKAAAALLRSRGEIHPDYKDKNQLPVPLVVIKPGDWVTSTTHGHGLVLAGDRLHSYQVMHRNNDELYVEHYAAGELSADGVRQPWADSVLALLGAEVSDV